MLSYLLFLFGLNSYMNCGNISLCGVLTIELGIGKSVYNHTDVSVHGLWPQTGNYGSSGCVYPGGNPDDPIPIVSCYTDTNFQKHEFLKHGICASNSADNYFTQVCQLSSEVIPTIRDLKNEKKGIKEIANDMELLGYEVFSIDNTNGQLLFSVCADKENRWIFSKVKDFEEKCG